MKTVKTYHANIYVGRREGHAGRLHSRDVVERICDEYCALVGLCVTITQTEYVYKDDHEPGAIVGIINYPRFPLEPQKIWAHSLALAELLRVGLGQIRVSVEFPDETVTLGDCSTLQDEKKEEGGEQKCPQTQS